MPYIGNDIRANQDYKTIDDISGSFNGSTTSFALLVGGASPVPFPKYETQLIISVGGVVQEPDSSGTTGFQLTGTNIVFSSAPAAGEAFFGVILAGADYLNAGGTFPDGTNSVPSISFTTDTDTGFFRVSSGLIALASNGTTSFQFPSGLGSSGQLLTTNGAGVISYTDAPSGATGGGSDKVIIENGTTITTNYTIGTTFGSTCNAGSFGPITINSGVVVTIPTGESWTVI